MLIPDANVLLDAINESGPHHDSSKHWIERALSGTETVGFDWVVLLGFLRLSTKRGVLPSPLSISDAWDEVDGWTSRSRATRLVGALPVTRRPARSTGRPSSVAQRWCYDEVHVGQDLCRA